MSDERIEKLESSLRLLRDRVTQLDRDRSADRVRAGLDLVACMVAAALFVLTATSWRTASDSDGFLDQATTLWGMAPEGWQAVVTLLLVVLLAAGTVGAFVGDSGRYTHLFFVLIGVLAVIAITFLVGHVEPDGWYDPEDTDTDAGVGRWLGGLASLALAVIHGTRADEVRH